MNKNLLITAVIGLVAGLGQVKTQADQVFTSGPISGVISGNQIGNPAEVYNRVDTVSFVVSEPVNLNTVELGLWVYPGSTPASINWSIGTLAFGSDLSSGTNAALSNIFLKNNASLTNGSNYDIYDSTFSVSSPVLTVGSKYWLTLSNAVDSLSLDSPVYWDENNNYSSGQTWESYIVGNTTYGTPSGLPPEAFTLFGTQGVPNNNPDSVPDTASTCLLLGLGLAGLALASRKKVAAAA
jgi:hypothetical protein